MSRIGKKPIAIPAGVKLTRENSVIKVEGPKGVLTRSMPAEIAVAVEEGNVVVSTTNQSRQADCLHGLMRTLVSNMITGVSAGFQKTLEISGVGYRAELAGKTLKLFLGYSTPMQYAIPDGISIKVEKQVTVSVLGSDKEQVGRVAAEIRSLKKPEPYKGKGIKYLGERIRRKVGKSAGA